MLRVNSIMMFIILVTFVKCKATNFLVLAEIKFCAKRNIIKYLYDEMFTY